MTRVAVGSQSSATAASSITTSSPSATANNVLVLEVSWLNSTSNGTALTPSAPAGWSTALALLSSNSGTTGRAGYSVFYKTATGGVESPVFNNPDAGANLYAHGIISELPAGTTFDSTASSGANSTNNSAASTTGVTVPNTGTLANANSEIFTGVAIMAGTGLANAAIAFSGGSWTTDMSDQGTDTSVGALQGYKAVAVNTALNAVYTWTSDSTMLCYQAGIAVFSGPVAGLGPIITQQPANQTASSGSTATFTVAAQSTGGSLTYQWQDNSTGAFANVSGGTGATTASYTTAVTTQAHQGRVYRCAVTDGNGSVNSNLATLGVVGFPLYLWDTTIPIGDDIWLRDATVAGSAGAAALAASVQAVATAAAALTTGIALASGASAQTTLTAALTTQVALAAASASLVTLAAALTTAIAPAASAASQVTLTAALTTQITPAAVVSNLVTLTAGLTTAITPAAAVSSQCTVTASLTTAIAMAAAAQGVVTLTAALAGGANLAAAAQSQVTVAAALSTAITMAAAPAAATTLTAALTTGIACAASASTQCTVTASLTTAIRMQAAPQAVVTVSGALASPAGAAMAANAAARAQVTAVLTTAIALAAAAQARVTLTGVLLVPGTYTSDSRERIGAATERVGAARIGGAVGRPTQRIGGKRQ